MQKFQPRRRAGADVSLTGAMGGVEAQWPLGNICFLPREINPKIYTHKVKLFKCSPSTSRMICFFGGYSGIPIIFIGFYVYELHN